MSLDCEPQSSISLLLQPVDEGFALVDVVVEADLVVDCDETLDDAVPVVDLVVDCDETLDDAEFEDEREELGVEEVELLIDEDVVEPLVDLEVLVEDDVKLVADDEVLLVVEGDEDVVDVAVVLVVEEAEVAEEDARAVVEELDPLAPAEAHTKLMLLSFHSEPVLEKPHQTKDVMVLRLAPENEDKGTVTLCREAPRLDTVK